MTLPAAGSVPVCVFCFPGPAAYDAFWFAYSDKITWIPFVVVILYCLFRHTNWRSGLLLLVAVGLLFFLSDYALAHLKPIFCRLRPSHDANIMNMLHYVNNYHGGQYGFPSNHASNGFATATMLTLLYRRRLVAACAFLWAIGSCYSRMYLGVHFPTDILVGAIVGTCIAVAVYYLYRYVYQRKALKWNLPPFEQQFGSREPWHIMVVFVLTIIALIVMAVLLFGGAVARRYGGTGVTNSPPIVGEG